MTITAAAVGGDLEMFTRRRLIRPHDADQVLDLLDAGSPFADAMAYAESVHVHVTVADLTDVPDAGGLAESCSVTENEFERKFACASGLNVVLATLPTAEDELIPGAETRAKPYVDHLGIDLREVNEVTSEVFAGIPTTAQHAGWRHVFQDGPIRCCHVEMGPKHWVYPPEGAAGTRRPVEFAFGDLRQTEEFLGCDYRPIDPSHPLAARAADLQGCATEPRIPAAPHTVHVFEETSCNVAASARLLTGLRDHYGPGVDTRAFDLARPEGLVPLPAALFAELQENGFGVLPALVVDGMVRTLGWLPEVPGAIALIDTRQAGQSPVLAAGPTRAAGCCGDAACCS